MKVSELVAMLQKADQNADVVIAPAMSRGYVSDPLPFLGEVQGNHVGIDWRLQEAIVIGVYESVRGKVEQAITWPAGPV